MYRIICWQSPQWSSNYIMQDSRITGQEKISLFGVQSPKPHFSSTSAKGWISILSYFLFLSQVLVCLTGSSFVPYSFSRPWCFTFLFTLCSWKKIWPPLFAFYLHFLQRKSLWPVCTWLLVLQFTARVVCRLFFQLRILELNKCSRCVLYEAESPQNCVVPGTKLKTFSLTSAWDLYSCNTQIMWNVLI